MLAFGAVLGFCAAGLFIWCTDQLAAFRQWLNPPPKPRRYRVLVQDDDGWPLRSYSLEPGRVGKLLQDIDRDDRR